LAKPSPHNRYRLEYCDLGGIPSWELFYGDDSVLAVFYDFELAVSVLHHCQNMLNEAQKFTGKPTIQDDSEDELDDSNPIGPKLSPSGSQPPAVTPGVS
jgi:hypothetical protein